MADLTELTNASYVVINQRIEWLEIIPCYEEANEYEVFVSNSDFVPTSGSSIGTVVEKPGSCVCLFCCKAFREYENEYQIS